MKFFKFILLSLAILALFNGCKKDDPKPDCEANRYGTIIISNNSDNPYDIYVDDVHTIRLIGGGISDKIKIDEGNNRELFAIQVSGFLVFPTERTELFNVIRCSDYSWQIP